MARARTTRWVLYGLLLAMLAGCGRMLPMGGRDQLVKYTVSKGETLYSISWRYGYDHREVAAWNQIPPPYNIYPGQQLLLIAPHQMDPRPARSSAPAASSGDSQTNSSTASSGGTPLVVASSAPPKAVPQKSAPRRLEKSPSSHQQQSIAWRWPTQGTIVAGFSPGNGKKGLDVRGQLGQDVVAAAAGNVVYSGSGLIGYGNLIIIKHNDTYLSAYGHNRRLLVKEGTIVKQGEKIAEMGDSGKEGVILHFEIRRDGKPVNPLAYLPKERN